MKPLFLISLVVILVMTSCEKHENAQTPTLTPTLAPPFTSFATSMPTDTSTSKPMPQAVLSQSMMLYSGPGNVNYEMLAELPAGSTVSLIGVYGDYLEVAVSDGRGKGFIRKDNIQNLPGDLPVLGRDQVPWEPFYLPHCSTGEYDSQTNSLTYTNIGVSDTESDPLKVESPIRIKIEKLTGGIFKILGIPDSHSPDIQTPYWEGMTRMDVFENANGNYVIDLRDGTSEIVNKHIEFNRSVSLPLQIVFDQQSGSDLVGTHLAVLDENSQPLISMDLTHTDGLRLPEGFLPEHQIYFGTSVGSKSLILTGLTIETLPKGEWINPDPGPGLFRLAGENNITIGTELRYDRIINPYQGYQYCTTMVRDFNVAVVSEFSNPDVWPGRGEYNFVTLDRIVDYAHQHGWRVRASHLVFGEKSTIPDWVKGANYPPETYKEILKEYIQAVMDHFRGRVQEWSLANELTGRVLCPPIRQATGDFWFEKIYGYSPDIDQNFNNYIDYLTMIFGWARAEDPNATLIFNDGWNNPPYDWSCASLDIQNMHNAVMALTRLDQPKLIDVIGMQMHLNGKNPPTKKDVIDAMKSLAPSGTRVRIYITEMDVNLVDLIATYPNRDDRREMEATIYKNVMDACLESGVCDNFTTWGISDADSWMTNSCDVACLNQPDADPLMFDRDLMPKPAYFAVRDSLARDHSITMPNQ